MREKDYWNLIAHLGDSKILGGRETPEPQVKIHTIDGATWEGTARLPSYGLVAGRARVCCVSLPGQHEADIYLDIRAIIGVQIG